MQFADGQRSYLFFRHRNFIPQKFLIPHPTGIGGGAGSVAVEIAKRSGKIRVFAIEKKPLALELIDKGAVPAIT